MTVPRHKSDPFTGRSNVDRPVGRKAWTERHAAFRDIENEFGERRMARLRSGRDYVSGRRIA